MKRILIDVDGTLCETRQPHECYKNVKIKEGAAEALKEWKAQGHYIIIYTARNMGKYNNNIGLIIANQAPILQEWLKRHEIPYDELHFGKPLADVFIDDRAVRFDDSWENIKEKVDSILEAL